MLTLPDDKNAPTGNVAQWRGKLDGTWSALPISDEELVRRYQAGAGVKAIAKQLGTNHVKILRRVRATCGVIKGRKSRNIGWRKTRIAGKTVAAWQSTAWNDEWKAMSQYDETKHWGGLWVRNRTAGMSYHAANNPDAWKTL